MHSPKGKFQINNISFQITEYPGGGHKQMLRIKNGKTFPITPSIFNMSQT